MGRLFIIGNGFDCAHGNHTAYRYFRDWMLEQLRKMGVSEEQMEELPESGTDEVPDVVASIWERYG